MHFRLVLTTFFLCACLTACAFLPQSLRSPYDSWIAKRKVLQAERWAQKRQYDRAEMAYREAIRHHPEPARVLISLGDLYLTLESYDQALEAYRQALEVDPQAYEAQAGIWATLLERDSLGQKTRELILEEIEAYMRQAPTDDRLAEYLYAAYLALDFLHEHERKSQIRRRIVLSKPKEKLLDQLAQGASEDILRETDTQKRLIQIEEFYSLFPPSKHANLVRQFHLWLLATALQDIEGLRKAGEEWVSKEPDNRVAHYAAGYWFVEKEIDLEKAIRFVSRALELLSDPDPRDKPVNQPDRDWRRDLKITKGHYLDTLGWALYKSGRIKEAKGALEHAARILEIDHRLYYHLGVLYEHQGRVDQAGQAYFRSMQADDELQEPFQALVRLVTQSRPLSTELYKYFAQKEGVTTFTDVTEKVGLDSVKGGRVAWGDYDGDGDEDLLVDGWRLFRNDEGERFTEVTDTAGLMGQWGAVGGVWADFNNDGHLDFYMMAADGFEGRFWKNRGDGTFIDVTATAVHPLYRYPTEGAAWGDYNQDGWVDLYLANYEKPESRSIHLGRGTPDVLWRNNGNETFTDVTREAGLVTQEKMNGRGVNWGDYNNDGLPDIFVSNYRLDPNFLWRNNGDGTFTNVAHEQGVEGKEKKGLYGHTIGSEWGDYDNDGDLDLFSANLAHPRYIGFSDKSMLLENSGPPNYRFMERTQKAGIRYQETHSDPSWVDYDNDRDLDLFITAIYPRGKSVLYRNDGQGRFKDVTWLAGVRVANGWGSAFADFDKDGDLDLVVGSWDGIRLFANDGNQNSWLQVRVVGRQCNRDGIGSRVEVWSSRSRQIREVQGGKGTGTQHSLPVEFGLGENSGPVDLEVRNACGRVIRRTGVTLNQTINVSD